MYPKVMLIFQDSVTRGLVELILRRHKFAVINTINLADAVDRLSDGDKPDVFIADSVIMANSGLRIRKALQSHPVGEHVPLIAVTAWNEREVVDQGRQDDADAILSLGNLHRLRETIFHVLEEYTH